MATKHQEMQKFIRYYKEKTGKTAIDMKEVAKFAASNGWPLPAPVEPLDRLAKDFRDAAREEIRYDKKTGRSYRANHAMLSVPGTQMYLWIDIDEAPRSPMLMSLVLRREQMVGDAYHISLDEEHWNNIHPDEEPINLPLDLTFDVELRKNAPDEGEEAV